MGITSSYFKRAFDRIESTQLVKCDLKWVKLKVLTHYQALSFGLR